MSFFERSEIMKRKTPDESIPYFLEKNIIKPDDNVIDIGCGNGRNVHFLITHGISNTIGIDNNLIEDMISIGKEIFGHDLPIEKDDMRYTNKLSDSSFDVFLFNTSLHFLRPDELRYLLDKIERSAKVGARIVGSEYSNKSTNLEFRKYIDSGCIPAEIIIEEFKKRGYKKIEIIFKEFPNGKIFVWFAFEIKLNKP